MTDGSPEADGARKPIARCLGEAVGHLVSAVKRPVASRTIVERRSETRDHEGLRLRRTVIDEIEPPSDRSSEAART